MLFLPAIVWDPVQDIYQPSVLLPVQAAASALLKKPTKGKAKAKDKKENKRSKPKGAASA